MNTRTALLASLAFCFMAAVAWSQDSPPPPPMPSVGPDLQPAPPGQFSPQPGPPYTPPSPAPNYGGSAAQVYPPPPGPYYVAPPGAYVSPAPTYVYPPPTPYPGPVVMAPAPVLVAAPPLASAPWSVAVDALFLERSSGGSIPLGYTAYNPATKLPAALPTDALYSDDVYFPLEAGLRFQVGHKFSDEISVEGTYWGLQQWSVGRTIYGDNVQDTVLAYSPYLQMPALLGGLDDSLGYTYSSQIENVEANVLFRINNPSDPYWQLNWLAGARYVYLSEHLNLAGIDDYYGVNEQLNYTTRNNLVGAQTGLLVVHGWSRYQWEAGLKCGLMSNFYHQHGTDAASDGAGTPAGFTPYDSSNTSTGLSALFEVSIAARYRITDNLFVRLGYQFYDITGLALAPRQLGSFGHGGNIAFDGLSVGMQASW